MTTTINNTSTIGRRLDGRRRQLGMKQVELARRSGVSLPTVRRILTDESYNPAMASVEAMGQALGVRVALRPLSRATQFREREAERKARRLARMVQATSGLEGQAVDSTTIGDIERKIVHQLLAGPNSKLWA